MPAVAPPSISVSKSNIEIRRLNLEVHEASFISRHQHLQPKNPCNRRRRTEHTRFVNLPIFPPNHIYQALQLQKTTPSYCPTENAEPITHSITRNMMKSLIEYPQHDVGRLKNIVICCNKLILDRRPHADERKRYHHSLGKW